MSPVTATAARAMRAVEDTRAAQQARNSGLAESAQHLWAAVRSFIFGLPAAGYSGILFARANHALEETLKKRVMANPEATLHFPADFWGFLPALLLGLLAGCLLAPTYMEAAARFLGLGGILDRLPLLKPRAASGGSDG